MNNPFCTRSAQDDDATTLKGVEKEAKQLTALR
jgi:hypothetical protein